MEKIFFENGKWIKTIKIEKIEKSEIKGEILESPKFNDLIFEDELKSILKLILEKVKKENIDLLFSGSAGTGKTTTAKMIACETKKPFYYLTGSNSRRKIVDLLLNCEDNSIILIDEIHNLSEKVAEIIYPAIQDKEIYISGKRKKLNLMFIGTTTEPEKLPKPLRDRFKQIEFTELSEEKLKDLLIKKGCNNEVADYLINFSTNIRILNNLLDLIKLYGEINLTNLRKVFQIKKINLFSGLSELQEKYLNILKENKKMSLRSLSIYLRKSEDYIRNEIEPDLIRKGYINITSRGRELNQKFLDFGYDELKKEAEKYHSEFTQDEREIAIRYLNEHPEIKKKFGKRYLELVNFLAQKIAEGISPDEIDIYSFGNDINIKDSFENERDYRIE